MTSTEETLADLADEHLARLVAVPWESFAADIERRGAHPSGETTGLEVGGAYYDVSDSVRWESSHGGDILLTIEAYTDPSFPPQRSVRRTAVIPRPAGA
ncbi:MAG TPA: hypothetical protein VGB59_12955 [Allosphingosinicella sp.]|jgi:hypothetical protein